MNWAQIITFNQPNPTSINIDIGKMIKNVSKVKLKGGYNSDFDKDGNETGENEDSLIAQTRYLYIITYGKN